MSNAFIHTFSQPVAYYSDPTLVFSALCQQQADCLLLESAEISTKNSLKSLLVLQTAIKISCTAQAVTFTAKTANGEAVLPLIQQQLASMATLTEFDAQKLVFTFSPLRDDLDEDSKLREPTIFDGLRVLVRLFEHSETPILVGGLLGYDLVSQFIPMAGISLNESELACPDYCFYLAEQLMVIDHQTQQTTLQTFCFTPSEQPLLAEQATQILQNLTTIEPLPAVEKIETTVKTSSEDDAFCQSIVDLKKHIYLGDVFQIVPSRRFSLACPAPLSAYRQLKKTNPSPYMFFMQDEDFTLFGASPESALKYTEASRQLEIYPIAGSRPRGFNAQGQIDLELDARLELDLRLDKKEQAEHLMLVDLARNDIARVCETGSRYVAELMQVDRYSHIMHLVSRVVGKLRPEFDALQAYQACMNMGTLTGAPKIKAMQLIYQFEQQKRHSYGGAVGYLSSNGDLDTCIVIRSAFVQQGIAHIQAGCGVVLDSDPQSEADETRHKANAVINAILQTSGK